MSTGATVQAITNAPEGVTLDWVIALEWHDRMRAGGFTFGPGYYIVAIGSDGRRFVQNTEDWGPGADYDAALALFHETAQWSMSCDFDPTNPADFTKED